MEDIQRYKSKTKAKRYATVVGLFFNYIRKTTDIANHELYDAISFNRLRENSYMKRMMAYIEKCDLLAGIVEQESLTFMQGELDEVSTCRNFRQVRQEGTRQVTREIPYYNLDMIISLGYRIKSHIATRFRK